LITNRIAGLFQIEKEGDAYRGPEKRRDD